MLKNNMVLISVLFLSFITLLLVFFLSKKKEKYGWGEDLAAALLRKVKDAGRTVSENVPSVSVGDITSGLSRLIVSPREQQQIEEDCPGDRFISELYNLLSTWTDERGDKICFLNGAFVIQDEGGKVFNLLKECPTRLGEKGLSPKIFGSGGIISHDIFMNRDKFNRDRFSGKIPVVIGEKEYVAPVNLDPEFYSQNNLKAMGFVPFQYEFSLSPTLDYLCDPQCQGLTPEELTLRMEECPENNRQTKGVVLFYPFQILDPVYNITKRYLYLKIESSSYFSFEHLKEAKRTYVDKIPHNDIYPKRRERQTEDNVPPAYNFEAIDNRFYDGDMDYKYYNQRVRANNEFFVSQSLVNRILRRIGLSNISEEEEKKSYDERQQEDIRRQQKIKVEDEVKRKAFLDAQKVQKEYEENLRRQKPQAKIPPQEAQPSRQYMIDPEELARQKNEIFNRILTKLKSFLYNNDIKSYASAERNIKRLSSINKKNWLANSFDFHPDQCVNRARSLGINIDESFINRCNVAFALYEQIKRE